MLSDIDKIVSLMIAIFLLSTGISAGVSSLDWSGLIASAGPSSPSDEEVFSHARQNDLRRAMKEEAENYLENPSLGGWDEDDEIANWTGSFASNVDYRIDGLLGEYASVRSEPWHDYARQEVEVEAGRTYHMEAWFRVPEDIDGTATVRLDYEDAGGSEHESEEMELSEDDGWQNIELTVAEEDTGTGEISLYAHRGEEPHPDAAVGAAWFSDQTSPGDWPVPDQVDLTIDIEGEGSTLPEAGTHTHDYGEKVTVEATPAEDWFFDQWTGDHTGTDENITVTMDADKEITAHFEEETVVTYDLTINIDGQGSTDPEKGEHTYEESTEVNVTATPDEGWYFFGWTGAHEGSKDEITVVMDENKSLTAHFEEGEAENYLENPSLGGWDEDDEIANWTGSFASNVDYRIDGLLGEYASVRSEPWHDYARQEVEVEAGRTYHMEAWFRVPEDIDGTATVRLDYEDAGGSEHESEEIELSEDDGWQKIELTVAEEDTGTGEISLYAHRGEEPHPDVAVGAAWFSDQTSPGDWPVPDQVDLTIDIEGEGSTLPEAGTHTHDYGEKVTVEATPAEDWFFDQWTGDHTGTDENITVTMDADKEITAHFEEVDEAELILQNWSVEPEFIAPDETVTIEGEVKNIGGETGSDSVNLYVDDMEEYEDSENVEVEPGGATEVTFEYDDTGEAGTYDVRIEFYQHFDEVWESEFDVSVTEFVLTIEIEGEGTTDPEEGEHPYPEGEDVNVTATPDEGWYFFGWTGAHEGSEDEINVVMEENKNLTAHFEEKGEVENYLENPSLGGWDENDEIANWTGHFASYVDYRIDGLLGEYASVRSQPHYDYARQEVEVEAGRTYHMEAWFRVPEDIDGTATVRLDYEDAGGSVHESEEMELSEDDGWQSIELTVTEEDTGTAEVSLYAHRGDEEPHPDVAIGAAWFSEHRPPEDWLVPDRVDLTIDIEGEGTTDPEEGTHTHDHGEDVAIKATPAEDWFFYQWTGDHESMEKEITVTMDADKEITAWFDEIKDHDVKLTIDVVGEGSTEPEEGTHTYEHGDQVTVEATPDHNWDFVEWTGDHPKGEQKNDTITMVMDENKSLTAHFEEEGEVENYLENPSLGNWDEDDEIANWTGSFASDVDYRIDGLLGEYASVRSEPWNDYARQEVEVEAGRTYHMKAWFRVPEDVNGTAIVRVDYEDAGGSEHESEEMELSEDDGWQSIELTVAEEDTGTGEVSLYAHRDEEPHPDVAVGAAWFSDHQPPEDWPITLHVDVDGNGMVDIDPDRDEYRKGTEVSLTAEAEEGWYFVNWTGDYESEEENITIVMNGSKEITANFEIHSYDLIIDVVGEGKVDVILIWDEYFHGTNVTLIAEPSEGWDFEKWIGIDENESNITITMEQDKEITAVFEDLEEYYLTIDIEGEGSTDPEEGNHTYHRGEELTITAEPEEGWEFVEWTGDRKSTGKIITIQMDEDKSLTAHFEETRFEEYELIVDIEGEGEVVIEPEQELFEEGSEVILTAKAEEGWEFVEWTGDRKGGNEEMWITMDENMTITAVFEEKEDGEGFVSSHTWFIGLIGAIAMVSIVSIILIKKQGEKKGEKKDAEDRKQRTEIEKEEEEEKESDDTDDILDLEDESTTAEDTEEEDLDEDLEKKVESLLEEDFEEDG